jgi:tRNA (cytidine56-2'-O)-methyltransferase
MEKLNKMKIEVLRIGQRVIRDDRVTTHVALVARAFGASKIYMNEVDPEIENTIKKMNKTWGGEFEVEFFEDWKKVLKSKSDDYKIVHLTMYGEKIDNIVKDIRKNQNILIVVGAEKVPRSIYEKSDYNVSVSNQPHSEISALAIVLDRLYKGKQFDNKFKNSIRRIIPTKKGKKVISK